MTTGAQPVALIREEGNQDGQGRKEGEESNLMEGNVLLLVKDIKEDLLKTMDAKHDDLTRRIYDLVSFMSTGAAARGSVSRNRSSESRKRREPPAADQLPYFAEMMEVDPAPFVLNWSVMVTLLSIGQDYSSVMEWVPQYAKDYMEDFKDEIKGVSALSILFFSVEHDHFFSRYHGRVGKMWSIVLRASIASLILRTRSVTFARPRASGEALVSEPGTIQKPMEPGWTRAFGGKKSTHKAVAEVVDCLETTDVMAKETGDNVYLARRKRIRMDNVPGAGPYELERDWYVRQMRSKVLRDLSYGRSEARSKLIGKLMFVAEKIAEDFDSLEDAKLAGYEVVFNPASSPEEENIPEDCSSGIWKIPLAATTGGTENHLRALNNESLQQIAMRFPSLQAKVKYKREILSGPSYRHLPSHYDAIEDVSFHDLASTVLTAASHSVSVHVAMQTSPNSLRAIHFLAFGLRGLLKSVLKLPLSHLEKLAMGQVVHGVVDKRNGEWATTNVYDEKKSTGRDRSEGTVTVQMLRDSKLSMTVNEYLLMAPLGGDCAERGTERSEGGQNEEDTDDFDLDEDCFNTGISRGNAGNTR